MEEKLPPGFCPYKGLQPYTEQDRAFFFGRTRDQQIIISNLYAAQLTVFYGASGVGKTSVLLAGAVPLLKQEPKLSVVVLRNWQDPSFASQLKQSTLYALRESTRKTINADLSLPLDEFLCKVTRAPLFFIFDQFEEYFLYHPPSANTTAFEAEFARTINRQDLNVSFLLSLREDSLSKLDRFQGRIPTLMNNMLRLEHLDREGAQEAIIKPLEEYSRRTHNGRGAVTIEPNLVEMLLNDLRGLKVASQQIGRGAGENPSSMGSSAEIETPLLQMVLTRLWDEEHSAGSRVLRLEMFERLGRAANIARTHLDTTMSKLTESEREHAASILRYLVTPSGSKIAQEVSALASWAELKEEEVETILTRLSGPDMRIMRIVQTPQRPTRYEIFHDVMAQAILNWRGRYVAMQRENRIRRDEEARRLEEEEKAERQHEKDRSRMMRRAVIALSMVLGLVIGLLVFAYWQWRQANDEKKLAERETLRANAQTEEAKKANAELTKAINDLQRERDLITHLDNANQYLRGNNFKLAASELDEVIKLDPNNSRAYKDKGYALIQLGQYDEAIKTLEGVTGKDPSFVWGHYVLALAYSKAGRPSEAVEECLKVLEINPKKNCDIFRKDVAYTWFIDSPEYEGRCKPVETVP